LGHDGWSWIVDGGTRDQGGLLNREGKRLREPKLNREGERPREPKHSGRGEREVRARADARPPLGRARQRRTGLRPTTCQLGRSGGCRPRALIPMATLPAYFMAQTTLRQPAAAPAPAPAGPRHRAAAGTDAVIARRASRFSDQYASTNPARDGKPQSVGAAFYCASFLTLCRRL